MNRFLVAVAALAWAALVVSPASSSTCSDGRAAMGENGACVVVGALAPAPSQSYSAAVSFTRPADTTPYTAGDVVGAPAAALTFPLVCPAANRDVIITSVALEIDVAAIPSGMTSFRLHLYNVTPPSAYADNAVWDLASGDRASYLGYVDLGSPVDLGSTLYVESNGVQKQVKCGATTSLFGYKVTNGAYTPTSAAVKKITMHTVAP